MKGKVCLITGGTSGIGKQTGLELARKGATVVLVGRNEARGLAARDAIRQQSDNTNVVLMLCDLSSQQAIRQFATDFQKCYPQLHVLINNAGVIKKERELTADGLETTFAINHLAYFLLTALLLDTLQAGGRADDPARIINVASDAHKFISRLDFDNLQGEKSYRSFPAYCASKLANIYFTHALARRLVDLPVVTYVLHPGVINTEIGRETQMPILSSFFRLFGRSLECGAQTPVYLASDPGVISLNGLYFDKKRAIASSRSSYNTDVEERLWQVSEQLTRP